MDGDTNASSRARAPLHLWAVGLLLVLWNGMGVAIAIGAQTARWIPPDPDVVAYFDSQPLWLVLFADLAPLCGLAAAVALLLQSRLAIRLLIAQVVITTLANAYEVLAGTSLLLTSPQTRGATIGLAAIIAGELAYVWYLTRRRVLY